MAWSDSVSVVGNLLKSVTDSNNGNWNDAVSTQLAAFISQAASDSFALTDFTPTVTLNYYLTVTDDANNWADAVTKQAAGLLAVADTAGPFADAATFRGNGLLTASDSFTLSDAAAEQLNMLMAASDTLPTVSDAVTFQAAGFLAISDSFTFTDDAAYQIFIVSSGELSLTASDSFTFDDAVSYGLAGVSSITVSDSFTLTDAAAITLRTFTPPPVQGTSSSRVTLVSTIDGSGTTGSTRVVLIEEND